MSCSLCLGAVLGGLALGLSVALCLNSLTGDPRLSVVAGAGVFVFATLLTLAYGSLWMADPKKIALLPEPESPNERRARWKQDGKFETAELRVALVLGVVGGSFVGLGGAPGWATVIAVVCFAALGALVGHDLKLRYRRLRQAVQEVRASMKLSTPASAQGNSSQIRSSPD